MQIDGCANPFRGLERPVAFIVHCKFYWAYAIKHFFNTPSPVRARLFGGPWLLFTQALLGLYFHTPYVPLGLRSAVVRHFVRRQRPQKPLKQLLPFVHIDTFSWATACRLYRTDTLRVQ